MVLPSHTAYTAVGGRERMGRAGLQAVLLNRGGRYPRRVLFQELKKAGFDYIVSVESVRERYDVEELSVRFPFVRFILAPEDLSPGELVNLAVSELGGPLFFVLWDNMKFVSGGNAARMAEWFLLFSGNAAARRDRARHDGGNVCKRLCTLPVIQNPHFEVLPTLASPALFKNTVTTRLSIPQREGQCGLYPFDGVGIYDRERFIRLGGFDGAIKNFHWQLTDFGFRARLWGEEISSTQMVRLSYDNEVPQEDNSPEKNYRRFYLKNLAPVFRNGFAHLPWRRFLRYFFRSGEELSVAWNEFSGVRRWISENASRFTCDARTVADHWDEARPEKNRA
ncbi:MAG: hypothetical protein LBI86_08040 [Treponema sp.]|nr:hypothetical protein [Treponema sp.]